MFYVYAYLRKSDNTPYYIGKGTGKRYLGVHNVSVPENKTKIVFLESNLNEVGALALERRYIEWYGRKDLGTGILYNRTDGGEGSEGAIRSAETKKKMSLSHLGKQKPPRTDEHKKNIALSKKGSTPWNKGLKTPGVGGVKKGNIPWNKGIDGTPKTEEYKTQQSIRMAEWWKTRKEQKNV